MAYNGPPTEEQQRQRIVLPPPPPKAKGIKRHKDKESKPKQCDSYWWLLLFWL